MAQRRQIDCILRHAELEVIAHLPRNLNPHRLLRLARRAGNVRRQNHVLQLRVGRVLRRLFAEHVQRRARNLPGLESLHQRRVVNQFPARAVDNAHALLHRGQCFCVDHARCLRRQPHVQRDVIRAGNQLLQRHQPDAVLSRHCGRHKRIAADNIQPKALGALRDLQSNPSQPQNAQRLAAQFRSLQALLLPLAGVHRRVGGGQLASQCQHQPDSQLGHRHRIRARRIHHHNASPRGRISIDVVHAHSGAANHTQLGPVAHQRIVRLHRRAHHQRIGIGQRRGQSLRQLVMRQNLPPRLGREHGQCCRRNLLCQNNLHLSSLSLACCFILVKANVVLLAQHLEDSHHRRMRLALAPFVLGQRVGVHAQPLRHLILIEI